MQMSTLKINAQAYSLAEFLMREYELEFVTVRFQFVSGMLAFLLALGLRVRYTIRRYTDLSRAVSCIFLTTIFALISWANSGPIAYGGYAGLVSRYFQLHWHFFIEQCSQQRLNKLKLLANAVAVASIVFYCREACNAWRKFNTTQSEVDMSSETVRHSSLEHEVQPSACKMHPSSSKTAAGFYSWLQSQS
mmetsp:Transcript_88378/g.162283  ORF Transcript_88378/g.162283 Transcript_88378/m.162283 type:complete len:191 (-) Transcript_88378:76-648(-)